MNTLEREPRTHRNAAGNYEYLTFRLGNEDYGVDILKVQEIRGYDRNLTAIANTPAFIKGVVNLRGAIVPILDMRIKLNLDDATYDEHTVVIILDLDKQVVGMVVDSVSDVITMQDAQIKAAPSVGSGAETSYVTGIGTIDDRMVILVDIDRLMSASDLVAVNAVAA
ncbi:chemotaxis protein CheW [Pseudomonadota bacterium AL_CKDN230030165-1A_HGKHYDSX7]